MLNGAADQMYTDQPKNALVTPPGQIKAHQIIVRFIHPSYEKDRQTRKGHVK